MQPKKRSSKAALLAFALFLLSACTEQAPAPSGGLENKLEEFNSIFEEAGLGEKEISEIDSGQLLERERARQLLERVSAAESSIGAFKEGLGPLPEKEKSAFLALAAIENSRLAYYRMMVSLKGGETIEAAKAGLGEMDFSSFENECRFREHGSLSENYEKARLAATELSIQIRQIAESHPSFYESTGVESKKPKLDETGLGEFVEAAELASLGCSAFNGAKEALASLESAAGEESLCIAMGELEKAVSSIESAAEQFGAFSEKAAVHKSLSLNRESLQEKEKALFSIAAELGEFKKALEEECK